MYNEENSNSVVRPSGLRPPSRIPASIGLQEMTNSDTNARTMPPPASSLKHKATSLPAPEPAPKRKTLIERAGDGHRPQSSASTHARSLSASLKAGGMKPVSLNNSSSVRTNGVGARNISNGSVSSTMSRPLSAASTVRSQTSMSRSRVPSYDRGGFARSVSVSTHRNEEYELDGMASKRKGMNPPFLPAASSPQFMRQSGISSDLLPGTGSTPISQLGTAKYAGASGLNRSAFETSLSTAFQSLSLQRQYESPGGSAFPSPCKLEEEPRTPSHIPRRVVKTPKWEPSPSVTSRLDRKLRTLHSSPTKPLFLTRDSNLTAPAWDTEGRLEDMELLYTELKTHLENAVVEKKDVESNMNAQIKHISELELVRNQLSEANKSLSDELSETKIRLSNASLAVDDARRSHGIEIDDLIRKHRNHNDDRDETHRKELDRVRRDERDEKDRLRREFQDELERLNRLKREELADQERALSAEIQEERSRKLREIQDLTAQYAIERQSADTDSSKREREMQDLRKELDSTTSDLDSANSQIKSLKDLLAEASTNALALETSMKALRAKIEFLESDNQAQSQSFANLHQQMQDAVDQAAAAQEKLRAEETLRRKLHNQVQELKGNIRVFCRVRPTLEIESEEKARIGFPDADADCKEVAFQSDQRSATGNVTTATSSFSFDRVFSPTSLNGEVFEEISQLIQSALDGYNVCIFCYGQTGSGKTFTMSSADGMIPRAVAQIYDTAKSLEEKGWSYSMEGSFIEVYNDTLNDLLGKAEDWEKKKHEIKHDAARQRTTVTDVTTVQLDSPTRVNALLDKAGRNRSVAATKANARSSRSHSVFILKLVGENSITGEKSEGTLNLVDLAGSERLSHSGATGERMKETQHINKSLACLGDVIGALGQGKEGGHVPYRNSKLTYLLQYSLGGNSKTLMFVMVSPLQAHMGESLTSLKFATKVHNTHIGTAKRQTRA